MKVSPEKIITDFDKTTLNKKIFLITGNEVSLIKEIEIFLLKKLRQLKFTNLKKLTNETINLSEIGEDTLFESEKKIIIYYDPKKIELDILQDFSNKNIAVIIVDNKIKNSSKVKKEFEANKFFISITCYKISNSQKEVLLKYFLNTNSIKLDSDSYWFLINNTDSNYGVFNSEIQKLYYFKNKESNIDEAKLLISNNQRGEVDNLFFSIIKNTSGIFLDVKKNISSSADVFFLISRIKFYIDLLITSNIAKDFESSFPKYLFGYKKQFEMIYMKSNFDKISTALQLIKKTEIIHRKNPTLYLAISQRFLINLKKSLN